MKRDDPKVKDYIEKNKILEKYTKEQLAQYEEEYLFNLVNQKNG
ncbi:hypothetical protein [Clostridium sp.]|nr:hypothetical protein [Clostridium sp.]